MYYASARGIKRWYSQSNVGDRGQNLEVTNGTREVTQGRKKKRKREGGYSKRGCRSVNLSERVRVKQVMEKS